MRIKKIIIQVNYRLFEEKNGLRQAWIGFNWIVASWIYWPPLCLRCEDEFFNAMFESFEGFYLYNQFHFCLCDKPTK